MTIVTYGSDRVIEQITKQLNKLIDVVRLIDLTDGAYVEREMLLAKITLAKLPLSDLKVLVELFNGCIIDICQSYCTVEITGTGHRLDAFVEACGRTQIIELVRSGVSGISRSA
jgi:acetolactate synthase-1/3 small subunit